MGKLLPILGMIIVTLLAIVLVVSAENNCQWWADCPPDPPTRTPWSVQPTYTPNPMPTCRPTATLPPNPSPTPYPTHTPYPTQPVAEKQVLAFPGVEGFGAETVGGRGGQVIEVVNLNDAGAGSLRAAIDASGPRVVVFRVAGTIELHSGLIVRNPYLTIAGQTAPGGGITLKNHPDFGGTSLDIQTYEVILRGLRIRPGAPTLPSSAVDALAHRGTTTRNVVVDHCSFSWATDENVSIAQGHDMTFQWNIIAEGLFDSNHPKGAHSMGMMVAADNKLTYDVSIHHNLFAHNDQRNPLVFSSGLVDVVNNVNYNAGYTAVGDSYTDVPVPINYVGNLSLLGAERGGSYYVWVYDYGLQGFKIFVQGNIDAFRTSDDLPEDLVVKDDGGRAWIVDTRHAAASVTTGTAQDAYNAVLPNAGAAVGLNADGSFFWRRDAVDRRIVSDVLNGTGHLLNDPAEVGGWPVLDSGVPYPDVDHDGMSDVWESLHGLSDGNADRDGDGYTNLEEFLNGTQP